MVNPKLLFKSFILGPGLVIAVFGVAALAVWLFTKALFFFGPETTVYWGGAILFSVTLLVGWIITYRDMKRRGR